LRSNNLRTFARNQSTWSLKSLKKELENHSRIYGPLPFLAIEQSIRLEVFALKPVYALLMLVKPLALSLDLLFDGGELDADGELGAEDRAD